jgi:hypothetical protein
MAAENFPITTPYGHVPGYELNNGFHRGEDRAMPMDTPVLVNGVEIGLSGNTGFTTGPHLHVGRFVGGSDTPPHGGGFHFNSAVVTEIGQDATNGKFVRVQADGASWVYLHLNRQTVPVGQHLIAPPTAPLPHPCTYHTDGTKQMVCTKQPTNWYNLNGQTFNDVAHAVVATLELNEPFPVGGYAQHTNGETYAMTPEDYNKAIAGDYSTNNGVNIKDLTAYVEPPKPATPPAAPEKIKLAPKYYIKAPILAYYDGYQNAMIDANAKGTLQPRAEGYYEWDRKGDIVNISTSNMKNDNYWINSRLDVVPEPTPPPEPVQPPAAPVAAPEPVTPAVPDMVLDVTVPPLDDSWKACYPIFDDRQPTPLVSSNSIAVKIKSLDGKLPDFMWLPPHKELQIVSWFEKGGVRYYRDVYLDENKRFYALPIAMFPDPYEEVSKYDSNHDGHTTLSEFIDYNGRFVASAFKSGVSVINAAAKSPAMAKFIDGIKTGTKKKDKVAK